MVEAVEYRVGAPDAVAVTAAPLAVAGALGEARREEEPPPTDAVALSLERSEAVLAAESVAAALAEKGAEAEALPLVKAVSVADQVAAAETVALGLE